MLLTVLATAALAVLISGPSLRAQTAAPASSASCLVVPFVNRSGQPNLDWIGESFVIALRQQVRPVGLDVLSQSERRQARALVGAPAGVPVSHATLFAMAHAAGVRWIVTGWYDFDGQQLTSAAELTDVRLEHLVPINAQSGSLAQIESLQSQLGWAIQQRIAPGTSAPASASSLPLTAYEDLVRARMAATAATQLDLLRVAVHLAPHDARIQLALGEGYLAHGDFALALHALDAVPVGNPLAGRADFDAALAAYRLGQFASATERFRALQQWLPLPAVTNNLELAQALASHQPTGNQLETAFPEDGYRQLARVAAAYRRDQNGGLAAAQQVGAELNRGEHLLAQGGLEAARQAFTAALAPSANAQPADLARAHAGLGDIAWARHDRAAAGRELQAALEADPSCPAALKLQRQMGGTHDKP